MHPIILPKTIAVICLTSLMTLFPYSGLMQVLAQSNEAREGWPGRRVGAGTRDGIFMAKTLTALIPENNLGLTVAPYPTLFFYIPKSANPQLVEFVLNDENDEVVYETTFTTKGDGIISVSIPASKKLKPLEIGKSYHWYVSIISNPQHRASDISVDGWIKRVQPSQPLANQLEKVEPLNRATLFAADKFWYDALAILADLRRTRPDDAAVAATWTQLLQSVRLGNIVNEPLIEYQTQLQQPMATVSH